VGAQKDRLDGDSAAPYRDATEGIRSSARWLVAAFAGVGGALVAGVPLTDITKTDTTSSHFWLALLAVGVSLVAIGVMILAVSQVFTSRYPTLSEFSTETFRARGRRKKVIKEIGLELEESWDELFGKQFPSVPALHAALLMPDRPPDEVAEAQKWARRVLDYVNYEYARRTYRMVVKRSLAAGGTIVALGIVAFVFEIAQAPPAPLSVSEPTPVTLYLNSTNKTVMKKLCGQTLVRGVAVAGRLRTPEVAVPASAKCPAARLTVGSKQGVAVPIVSPLPTGR
jgi:hypothetical protein